MNEIERMQMQQDYTARPAVPKGKGSHPRAASRILHSIKVGSSLDVSSSVQKYGIGKSASVPVGDNNGETVGKYLVRGLGGVGAAIVRSTDGAGCDCEGGGRAGSGRATRPRGPEGVEAWDGVDGSDLFRENDAVP